jgi:hypothetical protein
LQIKLRSSKALSKSVKGLYFLWKGYISCCEAKTNSAINISCPIEIRKNDISNSDEFDRLILRPGSDTTKRHELISSQHGPGWVFGRLREKSIFT